jgi:hypothetical protein
MALTAGAAMAQAAVHPVAGKPVLLLGSFDLAPLNYGVEEYFLSGEATSYKPVGVLGSDGRWTVEPADKAPFTTRLVVVRPTDPKKFNGTVLVEWLNVSAGTDGAPDWSYLHRELLRKGYAYVGVSAQKVGIDGSMMSFPGALPLKKADPQRYASLNHPGDAFSYDIFTQAARAVRSGAVTGPLKVRRIIATGESQSAIYMTTYVNAIDPLTKAFDGYMVHSRFGGAAKFDANAMRALQSAKPEPVRFRPDLRVPVMTFISETDLLLSPAGYLIARQPNTDHLRVWEVAGTSHADTYTLGGAGIDSGSASIADLAKSYTPTDSLMGLKMSKPMNSAPQHHYVMEAAFAALDRWVRTGALPPTPPRIEITTTTPPAFVRDGNGNAVGGVRSPWMDAPVARLSGLGQTGAGFAMLFGTTEVFDKAKLDQLYPGGRKDYQAKFDAALDRAVEAGFILKADAPEIRALSAAMYPGG